MKVNDLLKRIIAIAIVLLLLLSLCACDKKKDSGKEKTPDQITGKTYDTGVISVLCPEGWLAMTKAAVFSEDGSAKDPNGLILAKGAASEDDLLVSPSIQFTYYPDSMNISDFESMKVFFENVVDLDPITVGGNTLKGFRYGKGAEAIYWMEEPFCLQITVVYVGIAGGDSIAITDADVQAILASFALD